MKTAAVALGFVSLLLVFLQDLRSRQIHVVLPFALFGAAIVLSASVRSLSEAFFLTLSNILFTGVVFVILMGYMSLRNKRFLNPFAHYFGLGDLLFYLAVTPLFSLQQYMRFFILSMLFSLAVYYLFRRRLSPDAIPLAGFSALLLCALSVLSAVFPAARQMLLAV